MSMSVIQRGELEDRLSAGRALARKLAQRDYDQTVVLAIPRGGVPVAAEIARILEAPMDLILVRKIGVPGQEELALGAIVDGEHPELILNDEIRVMCDISDAAIQTIKTRELGEIERRRHRYCGNREPVPVANCTVIVVDDGVATGATMRAALAGLRRHKPARLVLAIGVASEAILDQLYTQVDEIFCLIAPEPLQSVGLHYRDFDQVSDDEVVDLLKQGNRRPSEPGNG